MHTDTEFKYRIAKPKEAGYLAQLSRRHVEHGLHWSWTASRIREKIIDRNTIVLIGCNRWQVAGFAVMEFRQTTAHLLLLAVRPGFRRQGIASGLVRWLTQSAREAGVRRIRLEVRRSNEAAHQFYAKLGYVRVGLVHGYYQGRESAVIMQRSLVAQDTDTLPVHIALDGGKVRLRIGRD